MIPPYRLISVPALVYRVSRSPEPRALPAWEHILSSARGRYDDPLDRYRVLYASSSPVGALIETVADLRPHYQRVAEIAAVADDEEDEDAAYARLLAQTKSAMAARLAERYLSAMHVVDQGASFVDLAAGTSRSRIELEIDSGELKIGDLLGRDRMSARRASRAIYDKGHAGLMAPSAEAGDASTVAMFEAAYDSNTFRVEIRVVSTKQLDMTSDTVASAISALVPTEGFSALICPEPVHDAPHDDRSAA
ncbi:MAG TPA: RES domain-containing protein [Candidatus Elarobacter sp.]|jgi:hypothetical protein